MKDKPKYLWTPLQGFIFLILILSILAACSIPLLLEGSKMPDIKQGIKLLTSIYYGLIAVICTSIMCLTYISVKKQ